MKIAIQTKTYSNEFDWYSKDSSFKRLAEQQWARWHNEVCDGVWFGLTNQGGKMFFLAGKIPTRRKDFASRNIVDFVIMQPEPDKPEEREQLARLTSDLLKKYQDINNVDSTFDKWADEICVSLAEKCSYDYTPFPILETSLSSESGASIGSFEYPLDCMDERERIANALGSLLEKDFLIGCIQYPVKRFFEKLGNTLSCDTQIAVFSSETERKEVVPPFPTKRQMIKTIIHPLSIGLLTVLIIISLLWHQNSQKATQIQNLNNQISTLEAALEKASNELQAKKAEIEELKKQINSSKELPPQETPAQKSGNPVE